MSLGLFEALTLLSITCASATFNFPELNPDLGKYQDASKVYPLVEPFYILYRNYEEDPVFGPFKCFKASQVGEEEDEKYPLLVQFGENQSAHGTATLGASEGYTVKNMASFTADGETESLSLYVTFMDVESCGVVRMAYVSESACTVIVPESQLGQSTLACDFIYDLLCGTSRYQVYDDSCKF